MANEPAIAIAGSPVGAPAAALPEVVASGSIAVEVGAVLMVDEGVEDPETEWTTVIVTVDVVVLVDVTVSSAATSWGTRSASAGRMVVRNRIASEYRCVVR